MQPLNKEELDKLLRAVFHITSGYPFEISESLGDEDKLLYARWTNNPDLYDHLTKSE